MRARYFHIVQYEKHPITRKRLLTEEQIKKGLDHKSIKEWAYIRHDQDVYTSIDEKSNPEHVKGHLKPSHWHIVLSCGTSIDISVISKWFGVPENFIAVPRGNNSFLDCVQYLTHERDEQQQLGKRLYKDENVRANFPFRKALKELAEDRLKYGNRHYSKEDKMKYAVLYDGKTLKQCVEEDRYLYMSLFEKLKKFRMEYISHQEPPKTRINFYVFGQGGLGKGLICRAIARSLCREFKDDDDIFFCVGAKGAPFECYDGQPVIIWNDRRASDLLMELNGRGNVFNVFDTHPSKQKQNVKYGSINLCNRVNIVNSVESYREFLDGLAGEYTTRDGIRVVAEDKGQSYRRFPIIIPLHAEDFNILLNKGVMNFTEEFEEYIEYIGFAGSMRKIANSCSANDKIFRELEAKTVQPIIEKHDEVLKVEGQRQEKSDEEILKEFENYGKQIKK